MIVGTASMDRLIFGLILLAAASVSGCGQKNEREQLALDVRADTGRMEDEFGEGFGKAFRADPNSEPAPVKDGDVKPVSLTTEPVPIS